jgi:transcriptional regulator with GAF, ATPase, and Fis domain
MPADAMTPSGSDLRTELEERLRFEALVADLAARFVMVVPEEVDEQITYAQRRIVEALGLDRSTLFQLGETEDLLVVTHSWAVPGFEPLPKLSARDFPWGARRILSGEPICFTRIDDLPEEAALDKEMLRRVGPKSNVTFPLSAAGKIFGALSFGALRAERQWPDALVARLRLIADVFANTLARKRSEVALRRALEENQHLRDQLRRENIYLQERVKIESGHDAVVGDSAHLLKMLARARKVAPTDSTVLITGETGTGKELLAQAIHDLSGRSQKPMVTVNCAALPVTLIESELFGRERGAYTGAMTQQAGRFEVADGSTLFLDEIVELPLDVQAKLLRVLEEGRFERLGSTRTRTVNVRIMAATNRDLQAMVTAGTFRGDLFYRLNVFPIEVPPLRHRREDIPLLVWHFVRYFSRQMGKPIDSISPQTMEQLEQHSWPGNIRELRNLIERAMILSDSRVLSLDPSASAEARDAAAAETLHEVERRHLLQVLERTGWRISGRNGAAQQLGLNPNTLHSKLKRLGISRPAR